ncbi:hypothetical protein FACS1894103_1540 [Campylobacterota bacterium]|nr:hypothetical protein FACS1894103_1540 [Campylobacterota bacterium]
MISASSGAVYAKESARYADIYPSPQPHATKGAASLTDTNGKRILFRQTFWRDPNDETKFLSVQLDERILTRLAAKFGKDSVHFDADGSVTLKGKAEAFVEGWHRSLANNGGGAGGGLSGARMKFDIGFQDGAITGVRTVASPHHTSKLSEQEAALAPIVGIDLAKLEVDFPRIFNALGADIAAAKLSSVFHSAMIELTSKTLLSGSIDEALNRALSADQDFDGEIALEELVNFRFHGTKTAENHMNELAQNYIDYADKLFDRSDLLPASLRKPLIDKAYVPDPNAENITDQTLRIMTMDEVIATAKQLDEMFQQEIQDRQNKADMEAKEKKDIYVESANEVYMALKRDHINGKTTTESALQQMDNLSRKVGEYYKSDEYLEKEKTGKRQLDSRV